MEVKMNLKKSLMNDYYFGLSVIGFLVCVGFIVYSFVSGKIDINAVKTMSFAEILGDSNCLVVVIFSVLALVSLIGFIKRFIYIKSFENDNQVIDAKVVDISYVKDRCRVKVEYLFNGETFVKKIRLFNNKQTKFVHMDSEVKLLLKYENPKKVLISELYFD
ncbi:MAG: hypothetical protein K6G09_04110 [Treponema sp.]|nr:hypothetical protein [Treponema sp.]